MPSQVSVNPHKHVCVIGLRGIPEIIGGIESFCENVYPRAAAIDQSIAITLLTRKRYNEQSRYTFKGVNVRVVSAFRFLGMESVTYTLWALIYARLVLSPDVIHLHGIGPAFFTPLARMLGFLVIVTHHAPDYERPKWGRRGRTFLSLGERFASRWAHAIVCVSQSVKTRFLELYPSALSRTHVIRNATELPADEQERYPGILDELGLVPRRYILAVGRLDAVKGFGDLIMAFQRSAPEGYKLVIAGSDTGKSKYTEFLTSLKSDDIIFSGFRKGKELFFLYKNSALFVHPSHMEGYALVIGEALCAGVPILASDIPPHREFGLEDRCYFPASDVAALAQALSVGDYQTYYSDSAVLRQRTDSWDRVSHEYLKIYANLMSKKIHEFTDRL